MEKENLHAHESMGVKQLPHELQMYSREETARILGCHIDRIDDFRSIGLLHPIKTGKRYMFTYLDIQAFQEVYKGMDISNRAKALECYRKVVAHG